MSTGERLLPYVYAALETCWIDALLIGLVSLHFLGYRMPLVPLWTPFVPIALSSWMARQYKRQAHRFFNSNPLPGIILNSLIILFLAWLTLLVAQHMIPEVLYDFPLFGLSIPQFLVSIVLILLLCWRGVVFAWRNVDPRYVNRTLGWGASIVVLVIFVEGIHATQGGIFYDAFPLLLLIVFFVCLSLIAHTLSHLIYTRHYHIVGLQGNIDKQEREAVRMVTGLCLIFLLVTMFLGSLISPALINIVQQPLGIAIDQLITGIGQGISLLLWPVEWLLNALHISTHNGAESGKGGSPSIGNNRKQVLHFPNQPAIHHDKLPSSPSNALAVLQFIITHYVLPLLLIGIIVILLIIVVRFLRRKKHIEEELHENLWSWTMLWLQVATFLRKLFAFLWPKHSTEIASSTDLAEQEVIIAPTAQSVRAIYRALLNQVAKYGYPRQQDETPYEFKMRLCKHLPLAEQHLSIITEAYIRARYSGISPHEQEIVYIRHIWKELSQNMASFIIPKPH